MAVLTSTALTGITTRLADATMSAGSILQVLQDTLTSTTTTTSQSYQATGLSQTITPSSANSKILVRAIVNAAWDAGLAKIAVGIFKDSATDPILRGDQDGSNRFRAQSIFYLNTTSDVTIPLTMEYLDSPSTTSAITYTVKYKNVDGAGTVAINKPIDTYPDTSIYATTASVLTVMEVAG